MQNIKLANCFLREEMGVTLLSCGYCNTLSQTSELETTAVCYLTAQEARNPFRFHWAEMEVLVRPPSPGSIPHFFPLLVVASIPWCRTSDCLANFNGYIKNLIYG